MMERATPKILVLSDFHFGEGDALLAVGGGADGSGRARVDGLVEWLADQGPFREVVLLGDVWELWISTFAEARAESAYFLERLSSLPFERMVFLPGNHDHHLLVQHQMVEQILALRDDRDLEVPAHTQRSFEDSHLARLLPRAARDRFVVSYPDHFATVGERHLVFHHGHHTAILRAGPTIFSSGPLFILQRLEEVGLHEVTRSDLELAGTILFELMYAFAQGRRTRAKMNRLWERLLTAKERLSALSALLLRVAHRRVSETTRGTVAQDVSQYAEAVNRMLALAADEHGAPLRCDGYIFGHTHRAGIACARRADGQPLVLANAGTWLHEPAKRNASSEGTFLILDPDHIALYRQGDDLAIRPLDIRFWPERTATTPNAEGARSAETAQRTASAEGLPTPD